MRALQQKEYDKGAQLLRNVLRLTPDDAGASYDPWSLPAADVDSLKYGQTLLERIIHDRPLMGAYLSPSEKLYKWTSQKLGAKIQGSRIDWDPSNPHSGPEFPAEHESPDDGGPCIVRVRNYRPNPKLSEEEAAKLKPLVFERLWNGLIYELHNMENDADGKRLRAMAVSCTIGQDEFVAGKFY